jgi:hypothetical protein
VPDACACAWWSTAVPRRRRPAADYERRSPAFPDTPIADERLGTSMLYSSGTTGRPKGILRPLPDEPAVRRDAAVRFLQKLWRAAKA